MKMQRVMMCMMAGLLGCTLWGSEPFDMEDGRAISTPFQNALSQLSSDDQGKLRTLTPQENTGLEQMIGVKTQDEAVRLLGTLLLLESEKMRLVLTHPKVYGSLVKVAPHWLQALSTETLEAARAKHLAKSGASPLFLQSFYGELSWNYLVHDCQRKLVIALSGFVMVMMLHALLV